MKNLRTYFEIAFDDRTISDEELKKFSEDHLQRLSTNDPGGEFSPLLTATTAAHTDFYGSISSEDVHAAVRKSLTLAVEKALHDFQARVSRREGAIRSQFGKESSEYLEFFPQGLSEYAQADLGSAEMLMDRMVAATTKRKAELGQKLADEFVLLRKTFVTARGAQLGKKGAVSASKSAGQQSRAALEKQLTVNLLTLALKYVGEPERGLVFFDQSIVRPAQSKTDPIPPAQGAPASP